MLVLLLLFGALLVLLPGALLLLLLLPNSMYNYNGSSFTYSPWFFSYLPIRKCKAPPHTIASFTLSPFPAKVPLTHHPHHFHQPTPKNALRGRIHMVAPEIALPTHQLITKASLS